MGLDDNTIRLINAELKEKNYKFLDWANSWVNDPPEVIKCSTEKCTHHRSYSRGNQGYENIVVCDKYKYYYKYDSSD